MKKKKVIIIGAGIGGIATANLLARAGYDVSIYEQSKKPGGRAGILKKDGFTFDTGPSWYLMPEVFEHYFKLLGYTTDDVVKLQQLTPAYKVFFEHEPPITITSDIEAAAQIFERIEAGSGAWLRNYVHKSNEIYRLSLNYFLYSNFQSIFDFLHPSILKRAFTMLKLSFTPIHKHISSSLREKRLQQILEYPMVFLGTSPFKAPALYSLMSALDFHEGVFYPQGGIYTLIEQLVSISKKLGVSIHYSSPVAKILTKNGAANGIVVDKQKIYADIVISNADLHFTETKLLDAPHRTFPASYWDKQEAGPSALLIYLGVRGDIPELTHHNLLFVDDWQKNFSDIYDTHTLPEKPSIYICKPSETDASVAPKGHENVFVLVPLPAGVSISKERAGTLADSYIEQIEMMLSTTLRDRIVSKTIVRPDDFGEQFNAWQNTALGPSHILRQSAFFRTPNTSKKLKNLYYVGGGTVPGIGLPMCLISAELVYKRLIGDRKGGPVDGIESIGEHTT